MSKRICRHCSSKLLIENEEYAIRNNEHKDFEVKYMTLYTYCVDCGYEVITPEQIRINNTRFIQAKEEAVIIHKMQAWINNE